MSATGKSESFLERWWPVFVILFGIICVLFIDFWAPAF